MRPYEAMFILQPELGDEGVNAFVAGAEEWLKEHEGTLESAGQLIDRKGNVAAVEEGWRKRRLAYPIKGFKEGYYTVLKFETTPEAITALHERVRYNEDVVRYLVLRTDED